MTFAHQVTPGKTVKLAGYDPDDTQGLSRQDGDARLERLNAELTALQDLNYAAGQNGVLIVLQGPDTAGKDGTIRHVMAQFNPAGCRVETFKVPTPVEAAHDFLWRAHLVTPPKGSITIFNRSYYEDVLVVRVHDLAPKDVWRGRYEHINNFESLLADSGTIVLKFFLYISKKEQEERLRAREADKAKAWKLSTSDWPEHELYDTYMEAYEDALTRCSSAAAPWYIVPADHKWFRNLAVAEAIVASLTAHKSRWQAEVERRGAAQLAAIAKERGSGSSA